MKKYILLLSFLAFLTSCTSRNNVSTSTNHRTSTSIKGSASVRQIINTAEKYQGTPYKYAGTTRDGMDCSGLIFQVFSEHGISFPRVSRDQAQMGDEISKNNVKTGDLLYFATSGGSRVTHVGLVHHVKGDEIFFIHSSTSRGVIISSLEEKYWNKAFLFAKRVL